MPELTYRALQPDDFGAMHEIVSQWSVVRNLGSWPWPPEPTFTRNRCLPYAGNGAVWAILEEGQVIGTVALTDGELGYMLHPRAQGRGIITQAVRDKLPGAFSTFGWDRVFADIWADNAASRRVLQKFGFTLTREEVCDSLARGTPTASETWELPRATWQALSAAR